ncbi:MAG: Hsp20/alpha crystallin family protein [Pseudomonadota bacterium]
MVNSTKDNRQERKTRNAASGAEALNEIAGRLGDLFGRVRDVVEKAENDLGSIDETVEIGDDKGIKAIAGLRVRTAGSEKTLSNDASGSVFDLNLNESATLHSTPTMSTFEVHDLGATLLVTGGTSETDKSAVGITFDPDNQSLSIQTSDNITSVDLPKNIDPEEIDYEIRNGIIEISLTVIDA